MDVLCGGVGNSSPVCITEMDSRFGGSMGTPGGRVVWGFLLPANLSGFAFLLISHCWVLFYGLYAKRLLSGGSSPPPLLFRCLFFLSLFCFSVCLFFPFLLCGFFVSLCVCVRVWKRVLLVLFLVACCLVFRRACLFKSLV
jgi:hypothetical protein